MTSSHPKVSSPERDETGQISSAVSHIALHLSARLSHWFWKMNAGSLLSWSCPWVGRERRATGKELQGEEKVNISQKSSEVTRYMGSWGNWDITAIQGLQPLALSHEGQHALPWEGWSLGGKPNWGPSSISWATGSGATYLSSFSSSAKWEQQQNKNMSWAVRRILSFCFPDMPSFFPPPGLCTCCFLGPEGSPIRSVWRVSFPHLGLRENILSTKSSFLTTPSKMAIPEHLYHTTMLYCLCNSYHNLKWPFLMYLVVVCLPWLACKFHKDMPTVVYPMLGTFNEGIMY